MRIVVPCLLAALLATPLMNCAQTPVVSNSGSLLHGYNLLNSPFSSNVRLNEISAPAFRNFSRNYPAAHAETWMASANGLVGIFEDNRALNKIFYTRKGRFIFCLRYFSGDNFPQELSTVVQTAYPGFRIVSVVELFDGRQTEYGITAVKDQLNRALEYSRGDPKVLNE